MSEDKREDFYIALQERNWEKCESIIEDLKISYFVDEALYLEDELEFEVDLDNANNKGSEDGVDLLQDIKP